MYMGYLYAIPQTYIHHIVPATYLDDVVNKTEP